VHRNYHWYRSGSDPDVWDAPCGCVRPRGDPGSDGAGSGYSNPYDESIAPFAAGIFLAAPMAAIMSTINAQLLQSSATIIKDLI
jgi:hypothetical protein